MCEANVFLEKNGKQEQIMENAISVKPEGDSLILVDLFGKETKIKAKIKEIGLLDHKVVLEELK